MIISTFRKTDQKGFPNAYFYATKNNLGTNIFAKIIFLATTPIRRRLGNAKEKHAFYTFALGLHHLASPNLGGASAKQKKSLFFFCFALGLH